MAIPYKSLALKAGLLALVVAGGALGYAGRGWLSPSAEIGPAPAEAAAAAEPEVSYWTCPMHPQIHEDGPGKCPICGMDLVPVMAEAAGGAPNLRSFATTAAGRALMEIQTSPVERRFPVTEVRMVGKIAYDETRLGYITAWVPGRLDRLYVDYTGVEVRKGDHMVYIYSPELLSAQEELLQALKATRDLAASDVSIMKDTARATVAAARDKLRLWGLKQTQIDEIEKRGTPSDHITIYAPTGGTVVRKHVQEGAYVQTGARIYTIADLSQVWVYLDAYESDLEWLRYGQEASVTTEAYPGETFTGRVAFIDPVVDPKTRTVRVRVNLANSERKLKPDMFVHGLVRAHVAMGGQVMAPDLAGKWICPMHPEVVKDGPGTCDVCGMDLVTTESLGYVPVAAGESARPVVIPASAPLITGTRAVVYVEDQQAEQPTFVGREVVLGPRAGDYYIVRHGLQEGELVVTRGNFKIDSALQIQAKPSMMSPEGGAAAEHHHGGAVPGAASQGMVKGMQVPAAFQRQLDPIGAAYERVLSAAQSRDLEQTRPAFGELAEALDGVQADLLTGHSRSMWDELSMLLGNDAFEGREAKRFETVEAVLPLLKRHMGALHDQFGLEHQLGATPERAEAGTPVAFRQQLADVWTAYRKLHGALAGDDADGAIAAAKGMQKALAAVDMTLLDHKAHEAWMGMLEKQRAALREMTAATDLEGVRAKLPALSDALGEAIRTFGIEPAGPVYKLRCPMAFEGRGGTWLQSDTDTRNPYYGAAMLTCGDVVETILSDPARPEGTQDHE